MVAACCLTSSATWAQQFRDVDTHITEDEVGETTLGDVGDHNGYIAPAGESYSLSGVGYSPTLGAHLRARYNTRSYGQVRGNLDLGTMKLFDLGDAVWFVDGQVTMNDEAGIGYNAGIGYRYLTLPLLPNSPDAAKIAGISLWSDGSSTINDNFISQLGVSLEYLGDNWDVRWNSYIPFSDLEVGDFTATDNIAFSGDFLVQETLAGTDEPLDVTEFEVARRLGNRDAWVFGGSYGLFGDTVDTRGFKAGVRGYLTPDVAMQFAVNDDDEFGTNSVFSVTWFIGRTRTSNHGGPTLYQRMREPVVRNDYVSVKQGTTTSGVPLEGDVNGDGEEELVRVVHVNSSAAPGGDGSFENPLNVLSDIESSSEEDSIVLVHADSTFTDDEAVLLNGQRMLGEGGGVEHMITTSQFGDVIIPETFAGAGEAAIPVIDNTAGDAVTLASATSEVSNLSIDGGDRGIVSPSGTTEVNLNNLSIANTTGHGIELTPGTETVDEELQVRFEPMITDVTFSNIGGNDIEIDAASPEAESVPVTENIVISDVSSTLGQGIGIHLANNSDTVSITNYTHELASGAAGGGILIDGAEGAVELEEAVISDQAGFGISLVNSDASHVLNNVEITDTEGAALHLDGGSSEVDFTGKITQGSTGAALLVEGGHDGILNLFEAEEDEGVIEALFGDGLQLDDADGVYTAANNVTITGTTTGVQVTGDSDGTLTLADAQITDTTGTAIHFDGGSASMTFTGNVTQNNAATTLLVENGHDGTLQFNELDSDDGSINAFNGDGLQFDEADGAYLFNDAVVLDGSGNGADTAIDILGDSDGTFTFADTTITNPTGTAMNLVGGSAIVNFTGEILQENNATAVSVSGGHDGAMTLLASDASGNVITATDGDGMQFDNADGDYAFIGPTELDGSAAGAATGIDIVNGSAGSFTFGDTTIVDPAGVAFNVEGGSADVDFTGKISQSNNFSAISVSGGHSGMMTFAEGTANDGVVEATNGDGLQFNNADGDYLFVDAVDLNGGDAGVDIVGGSSGLFSFDEDSEITNPTGDAFVIDGSSATVTYDGTITNNAGRAVVVDSNTGGDVTFGGEITDTADGILVQDNTGGSFSFTGGADLDTAANDAVTLTNNTNTTITFQGLDIDTTSGTGFLATNSEGVQVVGLGNTIDTTTGVGLNLNNVEVGGLGVAFDSVSVDGATNGIVMEDVTGGPVLIGAGASSTGDGGVIQNTTGAGVQLTNVEDVSLNFMRILDGGDNGVTLVHDNGQSFNVAIDNSTIRNSAAQGVNLNASGSGTMRFLLTNNTLDTNGAESVEIDVNGDANLAHITIDDNSMSNTSGEEALLLSGNGNTVKTINLLVQDNEFTNDDPTAVAADFQANGAVNLNATLLNNMFVNNDGATGRPMEMSANNGSASVRLSMFDNRSTAANGGDDYFLIQNAGSFSIEDLTAPVGEDTVEDANDGTFDFTGSFSDDPGNIPLPE